jgi:Tol biopolymer transport system component
METRQGYRFARTTALALALVALFAVAALASSEVIVAYDATTGRAVRMAPDGSGLVALACGGDLSRGPGARYFVNVVTKPYPSPGTELAAFDEGCGPAVQLTSDPNVQRAFPRWSHDGTAVAFGGRRFDPTTGATTEQGLYVAEVVRDAAGAPSSIANVRLAVALPTVFITPSWASGGCRIAYGAASSATDEDVYVVSVCGPLPATPVDLTNTSGSSEYRPDFHPSANKIVSARRANKGGRSAPTCSGLTWPPAARPRSRGRATPTWPRSATRAGHPTAGASRSRHTRSQSARGRTCTASWRTARRRRWNPDGSVRGELPGPRVTALRAAGAEVWTWVGEGPPGVAPLIAVALVVLLQGIASAAYPGANRRIAFVEYTPTGSRIATVHPDGSGLVRLSGPGTNDAEPSWSAEGSRIVFQAVLPARPGRDLRGELGEFLALLDLDKTLVFSNQRRVSALTRPLRCRNPCAARLRGMATAFSRRIRSSSWRFLR